MIDENKKVFELLKNEPSVDLKPAAAHNFIDRMEVGEEDEPEYGRSIEKLKLMSKSLLDFNLKGFNEIRAFLKGEY